MQPGREGFGTLLQVETRRCGPLLRQGLTRGPDHGGGPVAVPELQL